MKRVLFLAVILGLANVAHSQYQYLGTYNSDGVPNYLDGRDNVPASLLEDIGASLPEGQPVPTFNPQLISSGYDTDIIVNDSADVWVTFVDEGAGYRNVLGFYTYDLNNPYTSAPPQGDVTIIFPNVSKQFSGGGLITGDRVKIGTFPPGTGIGWVLIANGWSGSVGSGNWILYSNPDFNPEPIVGDRYHNVLLNDTENNLIVLGFEDIRRDSPACDQDFNDALFYVSANPIEAIQRDNFASITRSDESSSGNDGGLESNGDLASAIAQRNYTRTAQGTATNKRARQQSLAKHRSNARLSSIHNYLPAQGFTGKEEALVSSPTDLIALTNASEVFSADYYLEDKRVAAALVTSTQGAVYNHTKSVCDRLNGGALDDIRYVNLQGLDIVYAEIETGQGLKEYSAWFSARETAEAYDIISLWNIGDYPGGDYLNFQAWGATPAQVFNTLNYALDQLKAEKEVRMTTDSAALPQVFVKSGTYQNGQLRLQLVNRAGAKQVKLTANMRDTEISGIEQFEQIVELSGNSEETVLVETGYLFDAGISVQQEGYGVYDALYLADGAWGVDYNQELSEVNYFSIDPVTVQPVAGKYLVERDFELEGTSADVINVFRNLKAGHNYLDLSEYSSLQLGIENNVPLEISIVEKDLASWENRLRMTLAVHDNELQDVVLDLERFTRGDGSTGQIGEVQSLVFSYLNQSGYRENVNVSVKNVTFGRQNVVTALEPGLAAANTLSMYPNPAAGHVMVNLPMEDTSHSLTLVNLQGGVVLNQVINKKGGVIKVDLTVKRGYYNLMIRGEKGVYSSALVVLE